MQTVDFLKSTLFYAIAHTYPDIISCDSVSNRIDESALEFPVHNGLIINNPSLGLNVSRGRHWLKDVAFSWGNKVMLRI